VRARFRPALSGSLLPLHLSRARHFVFTPPVCTRDAKTRAGKTAKMYRGGKICLTIHFKPLWAKNAPHFGVAHALCLGLAPWLAAEVPHLVETGVIRHKDDAPKPAST
jgi:hypothetical protein